MRSVGEILADEIDAALNPLKECVIPIIAVNNRDQPALLGSAILIEVAGKVFLCTAKHVIDENAASCLYIDGPSKFEHFIGDFHGNDCLDVAICQLSQEQIKRLSKYRPLESNCIASPIEIVAAQYSTMVGFPETKNRLVHGRNIISGLRYAASGAIIQSTLTKVRVSFKRKRMIDAKTRLPICAPEPHGMSGGAMFGVKINDAAIKGRPDLKLVGMMTDWPARGTEIFGPSMAIVMVIIRDVYNVPIPARLHVPTVRARCITL